MTATAALAAAFVGATGAAAGARQPHAAVAADTLATARIDGEYGLYVHFTGDSLVVQWLTAAAEPGRLEVVAGTAAPARFTTGSGQAHRVAVQRPQGDDVLLGYGAAEGVLHRTRVSLATPARPPVEVSGVDSLYVVGDTHGEPGALRTGLRRAGLVDDAGAWTGGRRHLVLAGDMAGRGPDVLRLLWYIYRLEQEAAQAGGRVHVLLGNHETMVISADLRYVHPQQSAIADLHGVTYDALLDIRHSVLGRWLAAKPAAIRVDRTLIAHGGMAPEFARLTLRGIDRLLAGYMADDSFYQRAAMAAGEDTLAYLARQDFFTHPRSLFWHRDYIQTDAAGDELREVLRRTRSDVHVVGHTGVPFIQARYGDRLIAAHTSRHGAELLLLVRERNRLQRFRIVDDGPPQPF
jgi:hypothetical protein